MILLNNVILRQKNVAYRSLDKTNYFVLRLTDEEMRDWADRGFTLTLTAADERTVFEHCHLVADRSYYDALGLDYPSLRREEQQAYLIRFRGRHVEPEPVL